MTRPYQPDVQPTAIASEGCILSSSEHAQAINSITPLAALTPAHCVAQFSTASDLSRICLRCALSAVSLSAKQPLEIVRSCDRTLELGLESAPMIDSSVLVAGVRGDQNDFSSRWIAAICAMLGGENEQGRVSPTVSSHVLELNKANQLLLRVGYGVETVKRNTGLILPFSCKSPASGSGTSRALPGTLMLPTGVPPSLYAECWLHECLHTELLLGEWLFGGDLAISDAPLPTPWRTVNRPANLLLHGSFVFVHVAQFMQRASASYASMTKEWELSAAHGHRICACDVDAAASFRLSQVREAMETLATFATFTSLGQRVFESIHSRLGALDS